MTEQVTSTGTRLPINLAGLTKSDYRGNPSTLCQGCGHNSISSQIISACYELDVVPENILKFSGIGCGRRRIRGRIEPEIDGLTAVSCQGPIPRARPIPGYRHVRHLNSGPGMHHQSFSAQFSLMHRAMTRRT